MAPIRYYYTGDEDQLPVTPPSPLNLDEDSDSWWAGVKHCFVAVPLASAIAATALSASLAFGLTQQTEDIVPQPPPTVVEDYYSPSPPLPGRWVAWLPSADEEIVPQPPPFAPDEDYWYTPAILRSSHAYPHMWYGSDDDQFASAPAPTPPAVISRHPQWVRRLRLLGMRQGR